MVAPSGMTRTDSTGFVEDVVGRSALSPIHLFWAEIHQNVIQNTVEP